MRVELGAPVVLSVHAQQLWHLPAARIRRGRVVRTLETVRTYGTSCSWRAVCGLEGDLHAFNGVARDRRLCSVCRQDALARTLTVAGELVEHEPSSACGICRAGLAEGELAVRDELYVYHPLCYAPNVPAAPAGPWSARELLTLYVLYLRDRHTLDELTRDLWQRKGYTNQQGAMSSVRQAWKREGWPTRPAGETLHLRRAREGARLLPSRKLSEQTARELHPLHWNQWRSINSIAKEYAPQLGLTASALCSQLCYTWALLDLPRHDRIEMTVRASTRHGLKRRKGSSSAVYKRFRAGEKGEQYDKPCEGITARGRACAARAMHGSRFCHSHQPDQQETIAAHLARIRERSPLHRPENLTTLAEVQQLLAVYWQWAHAWKPLSDASGFSNTQLRRWLIAPAESRMLRTTERRLRRALLEITPLDTHAPELEAAA
jgi:hypothetical protein